MSSPFPAAVEAEPALTARLDAIAVTYYADPNHTEPGRINRLFGGRGAYFADRDGRNVEI